jgi:sulfonate transport system substrate-binding protein
LVATTAWTEPKGSALASLADLKGKKVPSPRPRPPSTADGPSQESRTETLGHHPVNLKPARAQAALQSGSIDAWAVWYPFVATAKAKGARVLTTAASVSAGDGFEVTTTSVLADAAKSEAIGDLLVRLARAHRWVQSHADQWLSTYEALTGLPAAVSRQTVLIDESRYVPISTVISEEQTIADTVAA